MEKQTVWSSGFFLHQNKLTFELHSPTGCLSHSALVDSVIPFSFFKALITYIYASFVLRKSKGLVSHPQGSLPSGVRMAETNPLHTHAHL